MQIAVGLLLVLVMLVTLAALFLLPGALLAAKFRGSFEDATRTEFAALTLGFATFFVGPLAFFVSTLTTLALQTWLVVVLALVTAVLLRRRLIGLRATLRALPKWGKAELVALAATAIAFGYQLLFFDTVRNYHPFCIYSPLTMAVGAFSDGAVGPMNANLFFEGHQRMGVTAVLAAPTAVWGIAGVRIAWGLLLASLTLSTFVVSRRLGVRPGAAALATLVVALLPVLHWEADQNRAVLAMTAFGALLFIVRPDRAFVLGLAGALTLSAEPSTILGVPALAVAARGSSNSRTGGGRWWLALAAGAVIGLAPTILRYMIVFGTPIYHEHFSYTPANAYSFLGIEFEMHAYLGWPFHDELVRSSFNAWPNIVQQPLSVIEQFGAVLGAVALVGCARLAWQRRFTALLSSLLFFGLIVGALAANENWTQHDKRAIATMAYFPALLWIGLGLDALASRDWRLWAGVLGAAALLVGVRLALVSMGPVPEDERFREYARQAVVNEMPPESETYMQLERHHPGLALLPSTIYRFPFLPDRAASARALVDELAGGGLTLRAPTLAEAMVSAMMNHEAMDRGEGHIDGAKWRRIRQGLELPRRAGSPQEEREPEEEEADPAAAGDGEPATKQVDLRTMMPRILTDWRRNPPCSSCPVARRLDLSVPPEQGLDAADPEAPFARPACRADAPTLSLAPYDRVVAVLLPWQPTPVWLSVSDHPVTNETVVFLSRSVHLEMAGHLLARPPEPIQCLEVRAQPGRQLLFVDEFSMEPERLYYYSVEGPPQETTFRLAR